MVSAIFEEHTPSQQGGEGQGDLLGQHLTAYLAELGISGTFLAEIPSLQFTVPENVPSWLRGAVFLGWDAQSEAKPFRSFWGDGVIFQSGKTRYEWTAYIDRSPELELGNPQASFANVPFIAFDVNSTKPGTGPTSAQIRLSPGLRGEIVSGVHYRVTEATFVAVAPEIRGRIQQEQNIGLPETFVVAHRAEKIW